jgi:uncharacterized protein
MIVPDVNLLLYANIRGFSEHARARKWWEEALNGQVEVGLAAPALFGFIRLSTNPRVFDAPMPVEQAVERAEEWLERPHVRLLLPGARHLEIAFRLLRELGSAGNLTTDVQLAALAMEHQAELHSNDSDFSRFSGLRWTNPLR